jgi:protein gp37
MGYPTGIDYVHATWNPVVGCSNGCWYCYARRLNNRFKWIKDFSWPQYFPERLAQPLHWKKPRRIFVCSMGDLFDPRVPDQWRVAVADACKACPQHRFLFLTKRWWMEAYLTAKTPEWVPANLFPPNCWFGVSVSSVEELCSNAIPFVEGMFTDRSVFISFEPLIEDVGIGSAGWGTYKLEWAFESQYGCVIDWVIIGALTGPDARQPEREWVEKILRAADERKIPVWMKDNLEWPEAERRRELPEGLRL